MPVVAFVLLLLQLVYIVLFLKIKLIVRIYIVATNGAKHLHRYFAN